jgi:hypothetical protein
MAAARMMAVMDADMHTGANAADMNAYADVGTGSCRTQKGGGKRRADQRFHFPDSLLGCTNARVIPWARGTHT